MLNASTELAEDATPSLTAMMSLCAARNTYSAEPGNTASILVFSVAALNGLTI